MSTKCLSALQISTCPDSFNPIIYKISFYFFLHPALFQKVSSSPSGRCFMCNHTAAESKIIGKAWLKESETQIDRDRRDLKRSSEQQLYTPHSVGELQFTVTSKAQWKERKKTLHLFTLSLSFPPTDAKTPNQTVCQPGAPPDFYLYSLFQFNLVFSSLPLCPTALLFLSLLLFQHSHIGLFVLN